MLAFMWFGLVKGPRSRIKNPQINLVKCLDIKILGAKYNNYGY